MDTSTPLSLPFKTRMLLSLISLVTDSVRRNDGTLNRRLMNLLDRRIPASSTPYNGVATHDVIIDPTIDLRFRLFVPTATSSSSVPVIFFFHGGGFVYLSNASGVYDAVCRKLSVIVCSVEYLLSPEHKFPTQYNDAFEVLRFIDQKRGEIASWPKTADVSRCFFSGDSAGGNIAHHLAVRACQTRFDTLKVIGLFNIQPFFGGKNRLESEIKLEGAPIVSIERTDWMWRAFLPDGLDMDHWAVDVSGPNAIDISDLDFPPTVVIIGGFDPLRDRQLAYFNWLEKSGKDVKLVDYPTAIHAFYVFPELPETELLFKEAKHFIDQQCSKVST